MKVNGLIPAAGMSKRMGEFKPLMKTGNKTMIEAVVDQMLEAGVQEITVILGYRGEEIRQVLQADRRRWNKVRFVYNAAYETTQMLDSVKLGLKAMNECDWFFMVPGDMPGISAATYQTLSKQAEACNAKILFPVLEGYRKHPPLISWLCRKDILQFEGNGLRELWKQYEGEIMEIPLSDTGCTMDVDYPEDYRKVCSYIACHS